MNRGRDRGRRGRRKGTRNARACFGYPGPADEARGLVERAFELLECCEGGLPRESGDTPGAA